MDRADENMQSHGVDRQADERLVHALLIHMHDEQAARHRQQRVQRAIQAIRQHVETTSADESAAPPRQTRRSIPLRLRATRGVWAAAAMILIAVGIVVFTSSNTPAMASLNDILGALGRPGDRTFRIHVEESADDRERHPGKLQPPNVQSRPGLDEATLYLRDGQQFVLVRIDHKGGELFDGYDGRQSWRVRNGTLVEAKAGPGAGGIPMPQVMADVPFVDLQDTLQRMRVDYTVERLDQAPLQPGGEPMRHVLARRTSRDVKGPQSIEIWADAKTAMPRRIVFDQAKFQGSPMPRRLILEMVTEDPLPADWFSYTPHIAKTSQGEEDIIGKP